MGKAFAILAMFIMATKPSKVAGTICKKEWGPDSMKYMHMIYCVCQNWDQVPNSGPYRSPWTCKIRRRDPNCEIGTINGPMCTRVQRPKAAKTQQRTENKGSPQKKLGKSGQVDPEPWTLKWPFCIIFMLKKPCLKVQNLQYKFLDWKWPPPPLELFRKFICFGRGRLPLLLYTLRYF